MKIVIKTWNHIFSRWFLFFVFGSGQSFFLQTVKNQINIIKKLSFGRPLRSNHHLFWHEVLLIVTKHCKKSCKINKICLKINWILLCHLLTAFTIKVIFSFKIFLRSKCDHYFITSSVHWSTIVISYYHLIILPTYSLWIKATFLSIQR